MQEHKLTFEDAILLSESAIGRIASSLNTPVRFDGGYAPVVQQIITSVMSRDSARTLLAENLKRLRAENDALHRRLTPVEPGGGPPPSPGEGLAEERQRYVSAAALAATYFAPNEGIVLRSGDTVVLRIFGLRFSRGEDALEPGSSELMGKLEHAIHLFPNCRLTVEGHTEPGLSETLNQRSSERRAAAVAAYLRMFPAASQVIESRGWGSSFPVADNATAEGRTRNRRIEVLITPE
jgi:outer membrane protein OmpA-like peptidoglycan-associated protein